MCMVKSVISMCPHRFWRNIAGAAALELALVTPFLAVILLGLTDAGFGVAQQMRLNDAAQQGAQYSQVRNPIQGDLSGVREVIGPGQSGNDRATDVRMFCECDAGVEVDCETSCSGGIQRHRYLDVTITENYHTLFPYPLLGAVIPLRANVVTRLQ